MVEKVGDIHRMESKHVNWPHVVHIINCLSVALERIFLVLNFWTWVKVFHTDPAFDQADRIAFIP